MIQPDEQMIRPDQRMIRPDVQMIRADVKTDVSSAGTIGSLGGMTR